MEVHEIRKQLQVFHQQDEDRNKWLQKVLETYCDTADKLKDALTDVKSGRVYSHSLESERDELLTKLQGLQRSVDRSAFVLVLIDADTDGYVFKDQYLLRGTDGGREAAFALKSELQRELGERLPSLADLPFIIKLYANVDKLGQAMFRAGMHESSGNLRDFCRGFSQTGGLSEFIDVGAGDDRADHQIKGVLQQFKENPCCKHIVLGSCHDNGYVCHLDVIRSESSSNDRITLLKSFQTGREYNDLPFRSVRLPSLFRTAPFASPDEPHATRSISSASSKPGTATSSPSLSYAAHAAGMSDNSADRTPMSSRNSSNGATVLINNKGERLDRVLKKPSTSAFENFHKKKRELEAKGKRGPCNVHYLGGGCSVPKCQFWHNGFDKSNVAVQEWFVRFQACDKGLACRSASCFYGHVCTLCRHKCPFSPNMHHVKRVGEHEVAAG